MILQPDYDKKNEESGKNKMNKGKYNQNWIEFIFNIDRHRVDLFDNNSGINKVEKRQSNKEKFLN